MRHFDGWRYGLMGLPLAFVALPLYVVLPNYYAKNFAVPLASLGVLLLVVRMLDAVVDPLLGRWADRLFHKRPKVLFGQIAALAAGLVVGFVALFFPPAFLAPAAQAAMVPPLLLWAVSSTVTAPRVLSARTLAPASRLRPRGSRFSSTGSAAVRSRRSSRLWA